MWQVKLGQAWDPSTPLIRGKNSWGRLKASSSVDLSRFQNRELQTFVPDEGSWCLSGAWCSWLPVLSSFLLWQTICQLLRPTIRILFNYSLRGTKLKSFVTLVTFSRNEFSWADCYESCGSSQLCSTAGPDKALPRITSGLHIPSHLAQAG